MDIGRKLFWITLFVIIAIGASIRAPGVLWLTEVAPQPHHSFHPDDIRFISAALDFQDQNARGYARGYVIGMTTHLYVVGEILKRFLGNSLDYTVLIRLISLAYGVLTIALVGFIARSWGLSKGAALLSSALLALSPLHVMNSHLGTPDATATFYFYLTLFAGWGYLKTRRPLLFVAFAALVGASLAIKFFISLLVPLFVVVVLEERNSRLEKAATAMLVATGSFAILSFFNYTPWDLKYLLWLLLHDNVQIVGGNSPIKQGGLYLWDSMSALGLAVWTLFILGISFWLMRVTRDSLTKAQHNGWKLYAQKMLKSPAMVYISGFLAHTALIVSADIHNTRHFLVYVPLACMIAAYGFWQLSRKLQAPQFAVVIALSLILTYQAYTAVGVERLYTNDVRNDVASWLEANIEKGEAAGTFMLYSRVKGVEEFSGEKVNISNLDLDYFVTCDLEYSRYFWDTDATKVYHAYGGQERLNFYRDLFAGRLEYEIAVDLVQEPFTLEQRLIKKGLLRDLGTFTPGRCIVFRHVVA